MSEYHDDPNQGFGTMDRMIELQMGLAVGAQMARAVNQTMNDVLVGGQPQNLSFPGQITPQMQAQIQSQPQIASRMYYAAVDGKSAGPFSETEIGQLINDGRITRQSLVWYNGLKNWVPADNVPEIMKMLTLLPPALPQ